MLLECCYGSLEGENMAIPKFCQGLCYYSTLVFSQSQRNKRQSYPFFQFHWIPVGRCEVAWRVTTVWILGQLVTNLGENMSALQWRGLSFFTLKWYTGSFGQQLVFTEGTKITFFRDIRGTTERDNIHISEFYKLSGCPNNKLQMFNPKLRS